MPYLRSRALSLLLPEALCSERAPTRLDEIKVEFWQLGLSRECVPHVFTFWHSNEPFVGTRHFAIFQQCHLRLPFGIGNLKGRV